MSLDDDYFDLRAFVEKHDKKDGYYAEALNNINDFNNEVSRENKELGRQLAALKAAIVVKASDINITDMFGEGRYIHLELKHLDEDEMSKHFAAKGGKANKGNERPDMKKGGKTYEKRWGKAKKD